MSTTSTNTNDTDIGIAYVTELFQAATYDQAMYQLAQQSIKSLRQMIRSGRFDEDKASQIFQNIYLEQARASYEQMTGFKPRMKKAERTVLQDGLRALRGGDIRALVVLVDHQQSGDNNDSDMH